MDTKEGRIPYTEREWRRRRSYKKYREYLEEFKREALQLLASSGKSVLQIECELQITAIVAINKTAFSGFNSFIPGSQQIEIKQNDG